MNIKKKLVVVGVCVMGLSAMGCASEGSSCPSQSSSAAGGSLFGPPALAQVQSEQIHFQRLLPASVQPVQTRPAVVAARVTPWVKANPVPSFFRAEVPPARSLANAATARNAEAVDHPATQAGYQLKLRATARPLASALPAVPSPRAIVTLRESEDLRDIVRQARGVVVLDFYADWCGPCRKQGEIMDAMNQTASQHRASIVKVNVDRHEEIASRLGIESLPTLILVKDGKIVDRRTGITPADDLAKWLTR